MSANPVSIFFYGLFMDAALLASKGVHATNPRIGYVDGYCLHIGERATLAPDPDGRAYGVLMSVSTKDITALYSDSSVADYVAEQVVVTLAGAVTESAVCYNLPAAKLAGTNPEYAKALLSLATRLGLPDSYLSHIRRAL